MIPVSVVLGRVGPDGVLVQDGEHVEGVPVAGVPNLTDKGASINDVCNVFYFFTPSSLPTFNSKEFTQPPKFSFLLTPSSP